MTNKFKNTAIAALLVTIGLSAPALAAMVGTGGFNTELYNMGMMKMLDGNGDHMVTKDEFVQFHQTIFTSMDKNGGQQLDPQEWLARQVGN